MKKRIFSFLIITTLIITLLCALCASASAAFEGMEAVPKLIEAVPGEHVELEFHSTFDGTYDQISLNNDFSFPAAENISFDFIGPDQAWSQVGTHYVWSGNRTNYKGILFKLRFDVPQDFIGTDTYFFSSSVRNCVTNQTESAYTEFTVHVHDMQYNQGTEAKCDSTGIAPHYSCSLCGKLYLDASAKTQVTAEELVTPKAKHELEHKKKVDPTCLATGNIEYWRCDGCGKHYLDGDGITETDSVWLDTVPCSGTGIYVRDDSEHWQICKWCKNRIGVTTHTMSYVPDLEATCTAPGSRHLACVCGLTAPAEEIEPLGHDMQHYLANEPTCTAEGNLEFWNCLRCYGTFADEQGSSPLANVMVPAKGHSPVYSEGLPTSCQRPGVMEHWKCGCGALFSDSEGLNPVSQSALNIPISKHIPGVDYGYDESGHYLTCVFGCGSPAEEAMPHELHEVTDKEATCTEPGNKHSECFCGYTTGDIPVDVIPHAPGDKYTYDQIVHTPICVYGCGAHVGEPVPHELRDVTDKEATCTEPGSKHSECFCGYTGEPETTELADHSLTHYPPKESDCVSHGNIEYWSCGTCGGVFTDSEGKQQISPDQALLPLGTHKGEPVPGLKPSCMEAGMKDHYKCTACGALLTEAESFSTVTEKELELPALTHVPDEDWQNDGSTHWRECTNEGCEAKLDTGRHRFGIWRTIKNPEDLPEYRNKQIRYCADCNYWEIRDKDLGKAPVTGDENMPGLALCVMAVTGVMSLAIAACLKKQRKRAER